MEKNYFKPVVDNKIRTKLAKDMIWSVRKNPEAKEISENIVLKHASLKRKANKSIIFCAMLSLNKFFSLILL